MKFSSVFRAAVVLMAVCSQLLNDTNAFEIAPFAGGAVSDQTSNSSFSNSSNSSNSHKYHSSHNSDTMHVVDHLPLDDTEILIHIAASVALVAVGAVVSGLQVGLFSLSPMHLQIIAADPHSSRVNKDRAAVLLSLLGQHHHLLVSLLVVNAAALEALPVLLDTLLSPAAAVMLSITVVLLFGEIVPQAICTRNALVICSFAAPGLQLLMLLLTPVAWPISKLLDYGIYGSMSSTSSSHRHHKMLNSNELIVLLDLHSSARGGHLSCKQLKLIKNILEKEHNNNSSCSKHNSKSADNDCDNRNDHSCERSRSSSSSSANSTAGTAMTMMANDSSNDSSSNSSECHSDSDLLLPRSKQQVYIRDAVLQREAKCVWPQQQPLRNSCCVDISCNSDCGKIEQ